MKVTTITPDQNFGVGNSSQVWSKNSSSSGTTNGLPRDAFDGSEATAGYRSTASVRFDFDPPIPVTQSTDVYYYGSTNAVGVVNFNTDEPDRVTVNFNKTGSLDHTLIASNSSITSLKSVEMGSGNGETMGISKIVVDGQELIDPSAVDTVTDTPMCDFAVLDPSTLIDGGVTDLSNGNLVASQGGNGNKKAAGTIGVSSGKIYFGQQIY